MRSFAIALVTFVVVSFAGPFRGLAAAQPGSGGQPQPPSFPIEMMGGTPGVSVEIFLNAGKIGDVTLNTSGSGDFVLNLANAGKTRVTVYVDVCQDGKIVKVQFVTGDGQAPPQDESCRRRMGAVSFQSDCGVIRITLNFTNWNGRVVGCGFSLQEPKTIGLIGGGALVPILLLAGGSDRPAANVVAPPPAAITPPVVAPAPITNTTPAAPAPPAAPTADSFNGEYTGTLTVTENVCRFTSTAGFSARLNVNSSGTGTLEFTYQSGGQSQLYVFTSVRVTMNGSQGAFEAQTDSAQFGYRLIVQGRLSGTAFTGNISFFDSRPGNCHTGYVVSGTRR